MDPKQIDLLTEAEAAEALRISQRHLQRLNELGEGPPRTRLGERRIAYPRDGLTEWVRHRTSATKPATA
jgi:predicted DNA-binding transcriptional regulator AlpA